MIQVTRIDYTGDKVLVKTPKDEYLADKVQTPFLDVQIIPIILEDIDSITQGCVRSPFLSFQILDQNTDGEVR